MPDNSTGKAKAPPKMVTAAQMAADTGVKPTTIRQAVWRASKQYEADGVWPVDVIPKPDRYGRGYELGWNPRRKDVKAFRAQRREQYQSKYPQLADKEWLAARYPAKSPQAIADEVGCSRMTVSDWLARHGLTDDEGHALSDVPLEELEAAHAELGSWPAVGARYGIASEDTVRRAVRRKRAAAEASDEAEVGEEATAPA